MKIESKNSTQSDKNIDEKVNELREKYSTGIGVVSEILETLDNTQRYDLHLALRNRVLPMISSDSIIQDADLLAKKFVIDGQVNPAELLEKYRGGVSAQDVSFGYQFATVCAEYAVKLVSESENPRDSLGHVSKRFGEATLLLNDLDFAYALECFINKLAEDVTDFSIYSIYKKGGRDMKGNILEVIASAIHSLDGCRNSKRDVLIDVISDFYKISGIEKKSSPKKKLR